MTKEELIEKMDGGAVSYANIKQLKEILTKLNHVGINIDRWCSHDDQKDDWDHCTVNKGECAVLTYKYEHETIDFDIFISWFKEAPVKAPPKKRGPKRKPNKRERAEANIKAQRETLDLSEQRTFNCRGGEGEMTLLASYCYDNGYTYLNEPHTPQDALRVAKWIIDLEGK